MEMDVGDERNIDRLNDFFQRSRGGFVRARNAHDIGAGFFQLANLFDGRLGIGGQRCCHRLNRDRCVAAD